MRRKLPLCLAAAVVFVALALLLIPAPGRATRAADDGPMANAVFRVQGMSCSGCEAPVEIAVRKLAGIQSVKVSYDQGRAEVSYLPSQVGVQKIQAAIERLGYKAQLVEPRAAAVVSATAVRSPLAPRAPTTSGAPIAPALRELAGLDEMADLFRRTRGQPRLVLLLSPT